MQIFVTRKDLQGMCDWLSKESRLTLLEDMTGWLDIGSFVLTAKKIRNDTPGHAPRYSLEILEFTPTGGSRYVVPTVEQDFDGEEARRMYEQFRTTRFNKSMNE